MKKALVCGGGGFIGSHLVKHLKADGLWVRGVDIKYPMFTASPADDFLLLDLRDSENCKKALLMPDGTAPDEVYQLAADMGGMGFIDSAECEIMRNSALININMIHAAAVAGVGRYFFSSSVCVYRDMHHNEPEMNEDDVYPAHPDNEYGWEKLYAERMALAYKRKYHFPVRIARFQNCYGTEGIWRGGREKAPAALCRKVACAKTGGSVDIWGDGTAVRNFIYIDDLVRGILMLMRSDQCKPVNIGTHEYVTVRQLLETISEVAEKKIAIHSVDGPVGVESRNFSTDRIEALGWEPHYSLQAGIARLYPWILNQVKAASLTSV